MNRSAVITFNITVKPLILLMYCQTIPSWVRVLPPASNPCYWGLNLLLTGSKSVTKKLPVITTSNYPVINNLASNYPVINNLARADMGDSHIRELFKNSFANASSASLANASSPLPMPNCCASLLSIGAHFPLPTN